MLIYSLIGTALLLLILVVVLQRLADNGVFRSRQWEPFTDPGVQRLLLRAMWSTVKAALVAIVLALLLGIVLVAGRLSDHRWLRTPATLVVEFFRAVPLVLNAFGALVVGLMLYNGAVLAEIFRAGIGAVPRGQSEAAYSLGLRKTQVMRLVLLPQAVRIMLPAIVSQCVVALKDTALGFIIGYEELLRQGRLIYTNFGNIVPTMIVIAAIYILMCLALSSLASFLERRLRQRGARVVVLDTAAEMGGGGVPTPVEAAAR